MRQITDAEKTQIKNLIINDPDAGYTFLRFGLRGQTDTPVVGSTHGNSYRWDDGDMTDDELDGVCALDITEITIDRICSKVKIYGNGVYVLLRSEDCKGGDDIGEIIMADAKVVAVFNCRCTIDGMKG